VCGANILRIPSQASFGDLMLIQFPVIQFISQDLHFLFVTTTVTTLAVCFPEINFTLQNVRQPIKIKHSTAA